MNFFHLHLHSGGKRDAALHEGAEWVEEHGLKKHHLPGRNSSESKTIVNVTQSQSCRLAVICGPLLPIPIHSVRMEFFGCFSSTLWLREIRQKFVFLPKRCHSKGAPVFRAALRGRGLKCRRGPEVIAGQWNTNYSLTTWYLHVVAITGDEDSGKVPSTTEGAVWNYKCPDYNWEITGCCGYDYITTDDYLHIHNISMLKAELGAVWYIQKWQ